MSFDVAIVGGGPAGLAAALVLGRARKRVLLCDAGPRRNAAAVHVHGFVSRDGITPDAFRRESRSQLRAYPSVDVRDVPVEDVQADAGGSFIVTLPHERVTTRRVLLCTGMIDVLPDLPNFASLWGHAVFQCPYCHGWEVQEQPFAYLAPSAAQLEWAILLRGWSADVVALTNGSFPVPDAARSRLAEAGVAIDERPIAGLVMANAGSPAASPTTPGAQDHGPALHAIAFTDGTQFARRVLFAKPPQRQVALVERLQLALDDQGFVRVDDQAATSRTGIHAAGDLASPMHTALGAAAAGARAAGFLNHALTFEAARSAGVR